MAEVTGLRNSALPYPVYGVPFGITFPLLDADGDPISPSSPDSEVSKNGDTFADCTNEATEIATSSGICYLLLTATEMTADVVTVQIKSTGAKTTVMTLYPRKLVTLDSGTVAANAGDGTTLTLASSGVAIDDYYNGCLLVGTLDTVVEARVISDYVGSTKVATVSPAFNIAPDNNDTYVVYHPEGRQVGQATVVGWVATALPSPDTAGYPKVTIKDGTGTGEIDTTSGGVLVAAIAANAITATAINADAITAAKIADGAIDANTFAAGAINAAAIAADAITDAKVASDVTIASVTGAVGSVTGNVGGNVTGSVGSVATGGITAASIAADAIGASELAADAATEIAAAVWDKARSSHVTAGSFGQILQAARDGTAQAGAAGTITLDASASATTDFYAGAWVMLIGGTGVGQYRLITAYNGTSKVATISPNWATNPDNTSVFVVMPAAYLAGITGAVSGAVGSVTGAVGSVTGNVGGNVTGSVGSVASGGITAASIASDAITAAKIADGAIDAATFAAGAINAAAIASDAITDAKVASDVTIASVTGAVGSVTGAVGSVTGNVGGNVTGSVGSLATQAKSDVNAEVLDVLNTDTYAEPGQGAPAATTTLAAKINYLYKSWRNKKTQTSTTWSLFADDAATVDQKATVSDDATTLTSGEIATGP